MEDLNETEDKPTYEQLHDRLCNRESDLMAMYERHESEMGLLNTQLTKALLREVSQRDQLIRRLRTELAHALIQGKLSADGGDLIRQSEQVTRS